jgi:hypothetical protein
MQVKRPCRLQYPMQLHQAHRHHAQVGHHVVLAQEGAQGLDQVGQFPGSQGDHVVVGALGLLPPPGIFAGGDLGRGFLAAFLGEQDALSGVGVEGRVQVDQVDAAGGNTLAPEDIQVVAEEKLILPGFHGSGCRLALYGVEGKRKRSQAQLGLTWVPKCNLGTKTEQLNGGQCRILLIGGWVGSLRGGRGTRVPRPFPQDFQTYTSDRS